MRTIQVIGSEADIRGTGVFVQQLGGTPVVRGTAARPVGIVINCGWVSASEILEFDNSREMLAALWPFGPDTEKSFEQIQGAPFRSVRFYPVLGTSPVKATATAPDNDTPTPANSLKITAKKYGTAGNRLRVQVTANATDSTKRDARVYFTYGGVDTTLETHLAVQDSSGNVTDPGSDWVLFEKASGADEACVVGTYTLSGGSNGTLSEANFRTGMEAFGAAGSNVEIVVCAGVPDSLVEDVDAEFSTWIDTVAGFGRIGIAAAGPGVSPANIVTYVAAGADRRLRAAWPLVQRRWTYQFNGLAVSGTSTVDGGPHLAAILQRLDPWTAAMMVNVKGLTAHIVGLEAGNDALDLDGYADLSDGGVMAWIDHDLFGIVPYSDVTPEMSSGRAIRGYVSRYDDYVAAALASFHEQFLGKPLDVDLSEQDLGPNTGAQIAAARAFFAAEEAAGHIIAGKNSDGTDSPAYAIDAFSANDSGDLGDGRWTVVYAWRQTAATEQTVLRLRSGTRIDINPND